MPECNSEDEIEWTLMFGRLLYIQWVLEMESRNWSMMMCMVPSRGRTCKWILVGDDLLANLGGVQVQGDSSSDWRVWAGL